MRVRSVADFMNAVEATMVAWTPPGADWYLQPWFRGHGDVDWPLVPGWYRAAQSSSGLGADYYGEGTLLEQFRLHAPMYIERQPSSDWEWLFLMQHYGLPTRLLDWTESSLIALYFAIRDNPGQRDAAVWVLSPWWLNRETFGEYALFPADDPRASEHAPLRPGGRLTGRLPLAITPIRASSRIAAQRGVFTIHGRERGALDRLARRRGPHRPCLLRLVVPKNDVRSIRRELAVAGISESIVFPELAGLCRELKGNFLGW
jgi:hypothetical protein